ncbi:hypothetical protein [Oceanospirillum beijerinckii]|uniref:NADH-quinone oxidoreductase subunit B family protein n=1 Tax=Oceanospirillum beijerinckii TaxID=64976 RepID=UPI00040DA706|nr:hypothetical protein [Oceanospirillum beijerinckii]MAC47088.1 sulfhydrogenase subunit delta [Oceanospirillum sp.]
MAQRIPAQILSQHSDADVTVTSNAATDAYADTTNNGKANVDTNTRLKVAVHKFASCDGCQLAFLNAGADLLTVNRLFDIRHFAEAGLLDNRPLIERDIDVAIIEGSVCTAEDIQRLQQIRDSSQRLITIGACATSGGIQALRNMADAQQWLAEIYARPESLSSLDTATPISQHVKVDLELWGCPVNTEQLLHALRNLLWHSLPENNKDKVCMECKRAGNICVMVTENKPCLGPVTQGSCGAICPHHGRDCYGCYGPAENTNTDSLSQRFSGFGLLPEEIARKFLLINSQSKPFLEEGKKWHNQLTSQPQTSDKGLRL